MELVVFLVSLFGFLALGIPIAIVLVLCSMVLMYYGGMWDSMFVMIIPQSMLDGANNYPLMAIPFFVFAGEIMTEGGLSKRVVKLAQLIIGRVRGGLGYAAIVSSVIFAGLMGSSVGEAAALGSLLLPMMAQAGYKPGRAGGVIASGAILGPIIPPSIIMVLYCTLTGASVTNMFTEGLMIGIVIMFVLIAEVLFFAHKENWPKIAVKRTPKEVVKIFLDAIPALLTPIIILGGIYSGLLTATESAAVACVWAFIAGTFIYKELTLKDIIPILMKSAKSSAMILFIIAASTAFSWVFTYSGASQALVNFVIAMNLNKTLFCLVVAIILLIFGTFMEGTAIAVLLVPVLWPIASSMGINVIHFGMILCISNVIGTMTPPVAVNIFSAVQVTRSVRELKIGDIAKAEMPFFIGYTAVFFLCVFSEKFCTFLIR